MHDRASGWGDGGASSRGASMTILRPYNNKSWEQSIFDRPRLSQKPTPQEPNPVATAPPFGSCGVGLGFSLDLYRSPLERRERVPSQD